MIVSPSDLPHSELYNILLNSVAPRPIAWVSTMSASGQPNLAPFSFFNAVCVDPPLLAFAPGTAARPSSRKLCHGEAKDTLRNIRETKEFVVNIVTYELARGDESNQRRIRRVGERIRIGEAYARAVEDRASAAESPNLRSALSASCIRFSISLPRPPAAAW